MQVLHLKGTQFLHLHPGNTIFMNCNKILDSMSQEQDKEAKASSLKDLNMRLHEIYNVIDETNAKLEFLARNSPSDKSTEDQSPTGEIATLEGLHQVVDKINKKVNNMSRSTNIIVGS